MSSRPAWARGLKPLEQYNVFIIVLSRPAWARGLKRVTSYPAVRNNGRAPRGRVD